MSNLNLEIENIKNIHKAEIEIPLEKGIYCIAGKNGSGKSTIMTCLGGLVNTKVLDNLSSKRTSSISKITYKYEGKSFSKTINIGSSLWKKTGKNFAFNGLYEGSVFYGYRYKDSQKVNTLLEKGSIHSTVLTDVSEDFQKDLGKILYGDDKHYKNLKKIKNLMKAHQLTLENIAYFYEYDGNLISQYRMSSGECLLISLLAYIYDTFINPPARIEENETDNSDKNNKSIKKAIDKTKPNLLIIDEIEVALHPSAVINLISYLQKIIEEYNLVVILSSHSPELLHKINPNNIYMLELLNNEVIVTNPCYPSYAIRSVYIHDGFDYIILVEDDLAKYIVSFIIQSKRLTISKLIHILPVGGCDNVLQLQAELYLNNTCGVGTTFISILDGDVKDKKFPEKYNNLKRTFLPITCVEKFLNTIITDPQKYQIKKELNDNFFQIKSLDTLYQEYIDIKEEKKFNDNDFKHLYRYLYKDYTNRGIPEQDFIKEFANIIKQYVDFSTFETTLMDFILRN